MLAVINQLAVSHKNSDIRFWCDRGYYRQASSLIKQTPVKVKVSTIYAGKLRRYHGSSFWQNLRDIPTIIHNIFDILLVIVGFLQSLIKLLVWRPKVIFLKGGFVCLPVGFAAYCLRIPMVIHDSDAHPGLTNRLLAPLATFIATGVPLQYYSYPLEKSYYFGIPIGSGARRYSTTEKNQIKKLYGLSKDMPLVVVTGGGIGAKRINEAMVAIAPKLITQASVVHLSGASQYEGLRDRLPKNANYKLISFLSKGMIELVGAADVVVSRAGASAMAELAAVGASVVVVPNGQLVGGHQLKNARIYSDAHAVELADEIEFGRDPAILLRQIIDLLNNDPKREQLGKNLYKFAHPNAAKKVAELIERAAGI